MKLLGLTERLKEEFAGFTLAAMNDALGDVGSAAIAREQRLPGILHASKQHGQVPLLTRLFVLGNVLRPEEYEKALPSIPLDEAIEAGLVTKDIRSTISLRPVTVADRHGGGELLIASDPGPLHNRTPGLDHVMPVGGATTTLSTLATYNPGDTVLDLGTGSGYHALVAARAGATVVATDVSERALNFAQFNAALADLTIETRQGSLFEPVTEKFDRIISNPPFVITPPRVREMIGTYEYRDGGGEGDTFLETILRTAGDHLNDGGTALMLGNWQIDAANNGGDFAESWQEPLREWIGDREAWVVLRDATDPAQYAEMWLRDAGISGAAFEMAYAAWLNDLAAGSVGFGYITLGSAPGPQRFEDYRGPIGEGFADHTWQNRHLAALPDAELGEKHVVHNGLIEKRLHTPGQEEPWHIALLGQGRDVPVTAETAGLVGASDGDLSINQIIGALSVLLNVPEDEMRETVLPAVRELISSGLLSESR